MTGSRFSSLAHLRRNNIKYDSLLAITSLYSIFLIILCKYLKNKSKRNFISKSFLFSFFLSLILFFLVRVEGRIKGYFQANLAEKSVR